MTLFILAYLGGVLTIVSPCILPVLPFVFARADQPFVKSGLPLLVGMSVTFAGVATLAVVSGEWAIQANQYGRIAAIALLAVFGVTLLFPSIADRLTRPLVAAGAWLSQRAHSESRASSPVLPSFLLGVATGFLWAPCAGPILGLVLTGAVLQGANAQTSLLLLAYAAGAATSLAVALLIGGRVFDAMKRSLGAGQWIRRGLGVAVLGGVVAIALGLDTGLLTRLSIASTSNYEQTLLDLAKPEMDQAEPSVIVQGSPGMMMSGSNAMAAGPGMMMSNKSASQGSDALPIEGQLPPLSGATAWLNSPPLTAEGLRGKVVLIDFWTYSCINCLRSIPYVRAWAEKYKEQGLVVIGVHAPEFAFEKSIGNVRRATRDLKVDYPVAIDNEYAIWRAFNNQYWPAHYFIDAQGRIRYHHFGEGEYGHSEEVIQQLLAEAGKSEVAGGLVSVAAGGVQAPANPIGVESPETYVGYERSENFVSPGGVVRDMRHAYSAPASPQKNQWALDGDWTVESERAVLDGPSGRIVYRFHARDLHLVLGPAQDGKPVRFRVLIDGAPPGVDHGSDTDSEGHGVIGEQRLYQLIRQGHSAKDRTFEIEFLDPGAEAFAFTFG
jgi:cytochrome c biogenesis protein CcdA/thiol-disulfide isomerase/thioredoxin